MTNNELIDRYIYAVTRRLPADSRNDVARELGGLIADMLEEQTGGAEETQEQIRAVLTKLGNPHELAARYHPQPSGLIPQPYYTHYITVLRIVLAAACGGVAVGLLLAAAVDPTAVGTQPAVGGDTNSYSAVVTLLTSVLSAVFSAGVQGFAWVTVGFAIVARKGVDIDRGENYLDNLPELPNNSKPIGRGGAIISIIFSTLLPMILLVAPGMICVIQGDSYAMVFDHTMMRSLWWVFIAMGVSGVVAGCAELVEGYHTRRLMVITLGCNAVFAVCAVLWLGNANILSADYLHIMSGILEGTGASLMYNLNYVVLGGILLGVAVDSVESVYSTLKR